MLGQDCRSTRSSSPVPLAVARSGAGSDMNTLIFHISRRPSKSKSTSDDASGPATAVRAALAQVRGGRRLLKQDAGSKEGAISLSPGRVAEPGRYVFRKNSRSRCVPSSDYRRRDENQHGGSQNHFQ